VPLLGILLLRVGWRWSFAATGAISLLYLLVFRAVYREPEEDPELTEAERRLIAETAENEPPAADGPVLSLGTLLRQRKVIGLSLGFGAYNYVFYLLLAWLPSYLSAALAHRPAALVPLHRRAVALRNGNGSVHRRNAGGCTGLTRLECAVGAESCSGGRDGLRDSASWARHMRIARLQALLWISMSIGGLSAAAPVGWSIPALITPRASVGKVGGIVNFVLPGLRNYRADRYRLHRESNALLRIGLRHLGDLLADRDRWVPGAVGADRADSGRSLARNVMLVNTGTAVVHGKSCRCDWR